jgi:co-chaperonin GroES (HSP10)
MENNIIIPVDNPKRVKLTLEQAQAVKMPIEAMLDTVLVIHIAEPEKQKKSDLYIPEHVQEQMTISENLLVKGLVKSVGPRRDGTEPYAKVGDVCYVFPGGFGARIVVDGVEYLLYSERDLLTRMVHGA